MRVRFLCLFLCFYVHYIFWPKPSVICPSTELHQEFQGPANRQTILLPKSNDEPHPDGRTRLRLRLSSAPHGPEWSPGSHLRQRKRTSSHTQRNHTRLLQTLFVTVRDGDSNEQCQPNQLPINQTGTQYASKVVPLWFPAVRPVRCRIYSAGLVLFCPLWMSRDKSRASSSGRSKNWVLLKAMWSNHHESLGTELLLLPFLSGAHWKRWTFLFGR